MPKLFWKPRNEEVLQLSRPNTRSGSPGQQIFQLQDSGPDNSISIVGNKVTSNNRLSTPDLFIAQTHSINLPSDKNLEKNISEQRAQVNGHSLDKWSRNRNENRINESDFSHFQFPDDLQANHLRNSKEENKNLFITGNALLHNNSQLLQIGLNGQEVDLEDDITKMAAQRDQQRGTTRFSRGMMAPVISKDEDSRNLNITKRPNLIKQRSESGLDYSDGNSPEELSTRGSSRSSFAEVAAHSNFGETITISSYRGQYGEGRGHRMKQHSEDLIGDFNVQDIMAQSIRRHTMKGKASVFVSSMDTNKLLYGSRLGTKTPNDFTILHSENDKLREQERRLSSFSEEPMPVSREDVQILNLHGFMDSTITGHAIIKHDPKKQRRYLRRLMDDSPVDGNRKGISRQGREKLRRRRGKNGNMRLNTAEGNSDEVVLKDIDAIDENLASLVIGPKQTFKDSSGKPITIDDVQQLRLILTGNSAIPLSKEWLDQSFIQNKHPNISYGLIQKKGGPCGVLASVQAHMMKNLIFGSQLSPMISPASPLRPSAREWAWALSVAITEIIWRISESQKTILALPGSFSHFTNRGIGRYTPDGLTETITLYEFTTETSLLEAVEKHLQAFTSSAGCVLLLYSCLLTRGLKKVSVDMDAGGSHLINSFGYASQEVVNLMLTGEATTNTFDGDKIFGEDGSLNQLSHSLIHQNSLKETENNRPIEGSENNMVLKGIKYRSEIGLLSLFEHYGSCKVGSNLKSPEYPLWVICSESHYTVLFSRDRHISRNEYPSDPFDIYYYDGLALQEDEIKLTIDPRKEAIETELIAPLEFCIRTKWPKSFISWNGTDPIL